MISDDEMVARLHQILKSENYSDEDMLDIEAMCFSLSLHFSVFGAPVHEPKFHRSLELLAYVLRTLYSEKVDKDDKPFNPSVN